MDTYTVEIAYTILRQDVYSTTLTGPSREEALREATRRFRLEVARELEPADHPTILGTYVEVSDRSPGYRGRGLLAALPPHLANIPD